MDAAFLRTEEYSGEGLKRVVESGSWFVGTKNWKPANDAAEFDMMERHLETDEVFVLLDGHCTLLVACADDGSCRDIRCVPMQAQKVYCIPKGIWHNTITSRDAKLILAENRDTSDANSEIHRLNEAEQSTLRQALAQA